MAYTKEFREQVLRELESGMPVGKISRTHQISIPTIYNWKNKYLKNSDAIEETAGKEEEKVVKNTSEVANESLENTSQENEIISVEEAVQRITFFKYNDSLEEALSVCNHPSYKDSKNILFQKVGVLTLIAVRDNNIETATEAYQICKDFEQEDIRFKRKINGIINKFPVLKLEEFPILRLDLEEIITMSIQQVIGEIRCLIYAQCLEEALNICNCWPDQNNTDIIFEKARTLFYLGRRDRDIEKVKESYILCQQIQCISIMRKIAHDFPNVDWSLYRDPLDIKSIPSHEECKGMPIPKINHLCSLLIADGKLEEVLKIIDDLPYQDSSNIMQQKVKALFLLGKKDNNIEQIKESYEICQKFKNNPHFHFRTYIKKIESNFPDVDWSLYQLDDDEVPNFPSREEFKRMSMPIANKHLRLLVLDGNLEEAVDIINELPYQDNLNIMQQKVKALFLLGKKDNNIEQIKESYEICQKFKNNPHFQMYIKKIESNFSDVDWSLYQLDDEEVPNFPSREEFKRMSMPIVNKHLRLLVLDEKLEEALKIIDDLPYQDNLNIMQQKVKALFLLGKKDNNIEQIKESYEICQKFKNNPHFQMYIKKIESNFPDVDWSLYQSQESLKVSEVSKNVIESEPKSLEDKIKKNIIKTILMKIYCDFITASEIENAEIDEWYKDVLMVAYTHKKSRENALSLAKKLKEKYHKDNQRIKILNKLVERIKLKKDISFDVNDYISHLSSNFDFELVEKILREKALTESKEEKERPKAVTNLQVKELVPDTVKVSKKPEKRMVVMEGKPVTARYQQFSPSMEDIVSQNEKELKIKDVFGPEIFEIGKLLYVQMQEPKNVRRGCQAWGRLENLKEKSFKDELAIRSILSIIDRLDIETNDERNNRIYEKLEEESKKRMEDHEKRMREQEQQKIKKYGINN